MNPGEAVSRQITEELVLLAAYLLSSGRGLLEEPQLYGPLRCIDAARRVLAVVEASGGGDERLTALHTELQECMCGPMTEKNLAAFLDGLIGRLARLLRESDLIGPAPGVAF